MTEVLDRYQRVAGGFGRRLAGVADDQWALPTPCTDWTVRDLADHVVATHRRVLANVAAGEDVTEEWPFVTTRMEAALADPEQARAVVGGMFGEQPFEALVSRLVCADTLFHTWDLARATGQDERLDEEAVRRAMEFLEPLDEAIRRPGGFGPKLACAPDADPQARLLAFGGRRP